MLNACLYLVGEKSLGGLVVCWSARSLSIKSRLWIHRKRGERGARKALVCLHTSSVLQKGPKGGTPSVSCPPPCLFSSGLLGGLEPIQHLQHLLIFLAIVVQQLLAVRDIMLGQERESGRSIYDDLFRR